MKFLINNWKKAIRYIGLILGLILFLMQFVDAVIKFKESGIISLNWAFIACAVLVMLIIYFIQVRLWLSSMKSIGIIISTLDAIKGYWISFIPRYIPGSVWGYLGRSDWLFREFNIPFRYSNSGSAVEVSIIVISNIVIGILTINNNYHIMVKSLAIVVITFLSCIILYRISRLPFLIDSKQSVRFIAFPSNGLRVKSWLIGYGYSLINWILYGVVLLLVVLSMSLKINYPTNGFVMSLTGIFSIAWLIGFIVFFLPGGLGLREFILSSLLVSILGFGFGNAVIIAIILRLITLLAELFWICIALCFLKNRHNKNYR